MTRFAAPPTSPKRKIFNALIFCLGCILLVVGIYVIALRIRNLEYTSGDLKQDYVAIQNLKSGISIYSPQAESLNFHPPSLAMLLRPFANLPYPQLAIIWSLFSLVCLFATAWIIIRALAIRVPIRMWPLLVGILLCWYPAQANIALGQWSPQIALLVTAAWALLRKDRQVGAGICLSGAVLIKFFPALLVIYLVIHRRWRAVLALLVTFAIGYTLTVAVVGAEDTGWYFHTIMRQNVQNNMAFPLNVSLQGIFHRLFTPNPWFSPLVEAPLLGTTLGWTASVALIASLLAFTWRWRAAPPGDDLVYALYLTAMILLNPVSWGHSAVLLLLPLALLVVIQSRKQQPVLTILSLIALLLISLPVISVARALMAAYAPAQPPWYTGLLLTPNLLGLILLYALLAHQLRQTFRSVIQPR